MAPERTPRAGGLGLPGMRDSAVATADSTSVALFSQAADAALGADGDGPSREEVQQRVRMLYDRAESDTGTFNATRAMTARTRGRAASAGGEGRRRTDPALDEVARKWFDVVRASLGPTVPAALPAGRAPARPVQSRPARPAAAALERGREQRPVAELPAGPASRPAAELTARPAAALPPLPGPRTQAAPDLPATRPSTGGTQQQWPDPTATGSLTISPDPTATGSLGISPDPTANGSLQTWTDTTTTGTQQTWAGALTTGTQQSWPAATPAGAQQPWTDTTATGTQQSRPDTAPASAQQALAGTPTTGTQQSWPATAPAGTQQPLAGTPATGTQQSWLGTPSAASPQAMAGVASAASPQAGAGVALPASPQAGAGVALPASPQAGAGAGSAGVRQAGLGVAKERNRRKLAAARESLARYAVPQAAPVAAITSEPAAAPWTDPAQQARHAEEERRLLQPSVLDTGVLPVAAAPETGPVTKAERAVAFARAQIGRPCLWGAAGPGSYDDAGLTQAAWKAAGVALPRTASEQANAGTVVPLAEARPGDLIFFNDQFTHVGLCTGGGTMIHAPGPGTYVREESVFYAGESAIRIAVRPA
ncbi:NlpC/P60 family protein [Streptomyces sp. NPDC020490]|uniref:NlpC/P60 family protein n=1 Tax=Streptomyces sp. NPDC020490 TaxID=3365078 RepID=UPI0037A38D31